MTHLKRTHENFLFLLVFFILHTVERRVLSGSEFQGCSSHQLEVNCLYLLFNSHFKRAVRKKPAPQLSTCLCYYSQRQLETQFSKPFKRIEAWTKQLTFLASMFFSQFRPRDVLQGIYLLSFHKLRIQLFPERLSEKEHATIPKGIVDGFEFDIPQRNLKELH